ncbi:MAG: hypothetical protein D6741_00075 [Planctomycetota bacterium]|nr:MAG: hypothetical protein D6741_00075 [Planctomycetota bacterium]
MVGEPGDEGSVAGGVEPNAECRKVINRWCNGRPITGAEGTDAAGGFDRAAVVACGIGVVLPSAVWGREGVTGTDGEGVSDRWEADGDRRTATVGEVAIVPARASAGRGEDVGGAVVA